MEHAILGLCFGLVEFSFGLVLIIFGIIGWQTTQRFLRWLVGLFAKRRNNQRGFAIAPILYVLGLIGVMGGVLTSGYTQILKSEQTVQNGMGMKSDLQAAANTLSAQGVLSADGLTLCPPRSTHQTSGNPCAAAPVSLIQFGDYTGSQLPANYANAGSTGAPTEVGVFAAGSGVKVLDPYGHAYIYCRWENPRSSPAAPAFVLLSAGADGKLQTKCGDTAAQGDDGYVSVSVAAAINRAALWQANGTSNVSYGATGSQITIDNNGDLSAAGTISALSAAITNGITASTGSFASLTAGSATVTGNETVNGNLQVIGTTSLAANVGIGTALPINTLDVYGNGGIVVRNGTGATIGSLVNDFGHGRLTINDSNGVGAVSLGPWNPTQRNYIAGGTGLMLGVDWLTAKSALDIYGGVAIGTAYAGSFAAPTNGATIQGNVGIGTSAAAGQLTVMDNAGATDGNLFEIDNNAATPVFSVVNTGITTIGKANPASFDLAVLNINSGFSPAIALNGTNAGWYNFPSVYLQGAMGNWGGAPRIVMSNIRGSGSNPGANGAGDDLGDLWGQVSVGSSTVYSAEIQFQAAANANPSSSPSNILFYTTPANSTSTSERMRITSSGNVGINTTNPQATLDLNGYMRLAAQTLAPAVCGSASKGAIAMTTNNGLCFCNGSAWQKVESPTTACGW